MQELSLDSFLMRGFKEGFAALHPFSAPHLHAVDALVECGREAKRIYCNSGRFYISIIYTDLKRVKMPKSAFTHGNVKHLPIWGQSKC